MTKLYKSRIEYSEYAPTDKDLEQTCINAYSAKPEDKQMKGFNFFSSYHYKSGLDADVYYNDKYVVISYKGSDNWIDYKQDWNMWKKKELPKQIIDADNLWNYIQRSDMFGNRKAIATGYSLGASVAVYLGNKYGDRTVAFCPYGIGDMVNVRENTDNITNYGNPDDPVFMENYSWQIGKKKFVFNADNFVEKYDYHHKNKLSEKFFDAYSKFHFLQKYGNIDFATYDITGQEFLNKVRRYYDGSIESAIEKYTAGYTYKDIMFDRVKQNTGCPGYVDVKSYTREGKQVSGYRRDCPYH